MRINTGLLISPRSRPIRACWRSGAKGSWMEKAHIDVPVPSLRDLDNVSFFSPSPPVSASSILVETPSRIDRDEDRGQIHGRLARIDARALITRSGSCCVGSTPEVEPYPETSSLLSLPSIYQSTRCTIREWRIAVWIDRGVARFLPFRIRYSERVA